MADLTTGPETDTRQDSSEGPHRPFCPSLSRIININGHREEEAEEPQKEAAPEPYMTGKSSLEPNLTIWEVLRLFFTTDTTEPEKKAFEDISEKAKQAVEPLAEVLRQAKQITEPMAEVLRQAADFGSRLRAFTEEVTERSVQFLEEYRKIQAKLDACDLTPPKEALDELSLSELRALVAAGQRGIKAAYFCLAIDKVSYVIFGGKGQFPIGQKACIDLGKRKIHVKIDDDKTLTMPALTAQDKQIYSAVTSLKIAGNDTLLYSDIYKVLSGREIGRHAIPPEAVQQIDSALEKFTRFFEAWQGDTLLWREPLLFFVARDVPAGGHNVRALTVIREPVLWRFAFAQREITRIKMDYLRIGDYRSKDIRQYLLERIARIQAGADLNGRCIRIETLFTTLGAETAKQQKTTREKAERFLSFWTKVGFIKEFRRRKAKGGKTITGWEIIK